MDTRTSPIRLRITHLREVLAQQGVHALLVPSSDPHLSEYLPGHWQGRQWLSGFTGSMATLVVAADQAALFAEAKARLDANIARDVTDFAGLERAFADDVRNPGFVEVQWAKPSGAALEKVVERLKALKLTLRNVPMDAVAADGACIFTGDAAVERVLVGRSY